MGQYYRSSSYGFLYGLEPTDLTEEQLKKIDFDKLIEFVVKDQRAEKILGDRLDTAPVREFAMLNYINDDEIKNVPYLISQYNKNLRNRAADLEQQAKKEYYYGDRYSKYVFWRLLNSSSKAKELIRWIDGLYSVVNINDIDYNWVHTNYSWLSDKVINKILSDYNSSAAIKLVCELPEEPLNKYIEIISAKGTLSPYLLSNRNTPRKYIVKCLREIAGRVRVPKLNVELDKSILTELPSVMRLKLLESLLINMSNGKIKFTDIHNEEDLKPLLFGTAIKYNSRVENVVRQFKFICPQENTNEHI